MNDLSLGRLRIANPDEGSPETPLEPHMPDLGIPTVQQLPSPNGGGSYDFLQHGIPAEDANRSIPIEQPPSASHVQSRSPPGSSSHIYQRKDNLPQTRNIPVTYQDQQQAQFPRYPAMMPQNLQEREINGASDRPGSLYYTNLPVSYTANGIARQSSTRSREPSGTDTPVRTSSKRLPLMSSGARDEPYVDRYRQPSQTSGNGYGPQRRTSRNLHSAQLGSTPTNQTPLSGTPRSTNTPLSSSPYNLDGGHLSSSEDWQERGAAVGVQRDYDANGQPILKAIKKGVRDFNFGATLGEGSYSTVLAAKDRQTQKDYAIKVLDKRHIIKEKKVKYVNIEKEALNRLTDHPGVVRLYYTFQDERSLYFVLDLCSGGELLGVLKRMTTFDEECTRFYSAQILDTIEYMHNRGVIHRDLKPENVLLDEHKYIKITDFGTAKMLKEHKDQSGRTYYDPDSSHIDDRANSFVGTAEYVSPELLTDKNACKASDLWAFGCILYQLLAGRPPFKAANEYLTFQKIVALEYDFPRGFPPVARDLVERLLVLDPTSRLTIEHIKSHEFFQGVRWGRPLWQQKAPRLKPYVPPPQPPIRLNSGGNDAGLSPVSEMHSTQPTMLPPANVPKPNKPRLVTELPPPTELDIEWSPVLTRSNERILKLGNMVVNMGQGPYNPDSGNKLSRFFTGNTTKKRQRLVMVTSSARIILAAAGGEEKKSKSDINLLSPEADITSATDAKGMTHWTVSTRDKHYTFEDLKTSASAAETSTSALSTQEWLDAIDTAKEIVTSQGMPESAFQSDNMASPSVLSHSSTLELNDLESTSPSHGLGSSYGHSSRGVLTKQNTSGDNDSLKGRKRFSKRQSKSGLTAVF